MTDVLWTVLIAVAAVGVYFAPMVLAFRRNVPSPWSVVAINLFLGWTLVGWVVALALALREPKPATS